MLQLLPVLLQFQYCETATTESKIRRFGLAAPDLTPRLISGASHTKSRGLSDSIHRYWWIVVYRWYEYSTLNTVHTYQREGTGTERVCSPLIQVVSVVLRLDTDGLGADAIDEPCIKWCIACQLRLVFLHNVLSQDGACMQGCIHACYTSITLRGQWIQWCCIRLTMQYLDRDQDIQCSA